MNDNYDDLSKQSDDNTNNDQQVEKEKTNYDSENSENRQESSQENTQVVRAKAEADAQEEEGTSKEESRTDSQGNDLEEKAAVSGYVYSPPYYTPQIEEEFKSVSSTKKHAKEKHVGGWIAIGGGLALALIMVAFLTLYLLGVNFSISMENEPQVPSDGVNVTKNDGSITVNEKVGTTGYEHLTVSEVVELVADSVVEITTAQVQTDPFYGNYVTGGAGSGVIVSKHGYIITNNHVIESADEITVRLNNGKEYPATCVGGDADYDIAVLKIETTDTLMEAVLGSSAKLKVGDEVVAIGNPLGSLGGTVTDGIVSALDRKIMVDGHPMTLLQTNAAINPGNSGGGLFNMAGELIGIVNAKQSETGIESLGFAIPIDVAWSAAKDIMEYGYVKGKVYLGIEVAEATGNFISGGTIYPAGVYILESEYSDFSPYDRIVSVGGISVNGMSDYYAAISKLTIGQSVELTISRKDGRSFSEIHVTITVREYVPNNA